MLAKPFDGALGGAAAASAPRLQAMVELAPAPGSRRARPSTARVFQTAEGARRGRVAILSGCAQPVLKPGFNEAAIRLLNRHGIEVVQAKGEGCCGALVHHMGRELEGLAFARRNIDAWIAEMDGEGLDAIVITASGCGTTIKDYGFMFRDDPAYAEKAARVSAITQRHHRIPDQPRARWRRCGRPISSSPIIPPAPCSTASRSATEPKALLKQAGFTVKDVPRGPYLLRLGGNLQPAPAGDRRRSCGPARSPISSEPGPT